MSLSIARQLKPDIGNNLARAVFLFGDSHMLRNLNQIPASRTSTYQATGFFTWANALMGAAYIPTGIVTDPGKTSTFLNENYLDEMRASTAKIIIYLTGTNDCATVGAGGADVTVTQNAWITFWEAAASQGKTVVHCTIPPVSSANFDYKAQHVLNDWLLDQSIVRDNVIVADISSVMTDSSSATGGPKTGYLADGVHFSKLGAYYAGKELARAMANMVPVADTLVYSVASTGTDTDSSRKFGNAGLGFGTSGTHSAFAGTTGDVPGTAAGDLWDISTVGANVTAIASSIAPHSKAGNYWQLDVTTNAGVQSLSVKPSVTNWTQILSVGDYVVFETEVTLLANTTSMSVLWLRMGISDDGDIYYYDNGYPVDTSVALPEDVTLTLRTPPHKIKSLTGLSFPTVGLFGTVAGVGNFAYRIARTSLRKITLPDETPVL